MEQKQFNISPETIKDYVFKILSVKLLFLLLLSGDYAECAIYFKTERTLNFRSMSCRMRQCLFYY